MNQKFQTEASSSIQVIPSTSGVLVGGTNNATIIDGSVATIRVDGSDAQQRSVHIGLNQEQKEGLLALNNQSAGNLTNQHTTQEEKELITSPALAGKNQRKNKSKQVVENGEEENYALIESLKQMQRQTLQQQRTKPFSGIQQLLGARLNKEREGPQPKQTLKTTTFTIPDMPSDSQKMRETTSGGFTLSSRNKRQQGQATILAQDLKNSKESIKIKVDVPRSSQNVRARLHLKGSKMVQRPAVTTNDLFQLALYNKDGALVNGNSLIQTNILTNQEAFKGNQRDNQIQRNSKTSIGTQDISTGTVSKMNQNAVKNIQNISPKNQKRKSIGLSKIDQFTLDKGQETNESLNNETFRAVLKGQNSNDSYLHGVVLAQEIKVNLQLDSDRYQDQDDRQNQEQQMHINDSPDQQIRKNSQHNEVQTAGLNSAPESVKLARNQSDTASQNYPISPRNQFVSGKFSFDIKKTKQIEKMQSTISASLSLSKADESLDSEQNRAKNNSAYLRTERIDFNQQKNINLRALQSKIQTGGQDLASNPRKSSFQEIQMSVTSHRKQTGTNLKQQNLGIFERMSEHTDTERDYQKVCFSPKEARLRTGAQASKLKHMIIPNVGIQLSRNSPKLQTAQNQTELDEDKANGDHKQRRRNVKVEALKKQIKFKRGIQIYPLRSSNEPMIRDKNSNNFTMVTTRNFNDHFLTVQNKSRPQKELVAENVDAYEKDQSLLSGRKTTTYDEHFEQTVDRQRLRSVQMNRLKMQRLTGISSYMASRDQAAKNMRQRVGTGVTAMNQQMQVDDLLQNSIYSSLQRNSKSSDLQHLDSVQKSVGTPASVIKEIEFISRGGTIKMMQSSLQSNTSQNSQAVGSKNWNKLNQIGLLFEDQKNVHLQRVAQKNYKGSKSRSRKRQKERGRQQQYQERVNTNQGKREQNYSNNIEVLDESGNNSQRRLTAPAVDQQTFEGKEAKKSNVVMQSMSIKVRSSRLGTAIQKAKEDSAKGANEGTVLNSGRRRRSQKDLKQNNDFSDDLNQSKTLNKLDDGLVNHDSAQLLHGANLNEQEVNSKAGNLMLIASRIGSCERERESHKGGDEINAHQNMYTLSNQDKSEISSKTPLTSLLDAAKRQKGQKQRTHDFQGHSSAQKAPSTISHSNSDSNSLDGKLINQTLTLNTAAKNTPRHIAEQNSINKLQRVTQPLNKQNVREIQETYGQKVQNNKDLFCLKMTDRSSSHSAEKTAAVVLASPSENKTLSRHSASLMRGGSRGASRGSQFRNQVNRKQMMTLQDWSQANETENQQTVERQTTSTATNLQQTNGLRITLDKITKEAGIDAIQVFDCVNESNLLEKGGSRSQQAKNLNLPERVSNWRQSLKSGEQNSGSINNRLSGIRVPVETLRAIKFVRGKRSNTSQYGRMISSQAVKFEQKSNRRRANLLQTHQTQQEIDTTITIKPQIFSFKNPPNNSFAVNSVLNAVQIKDQLANLLKQARPQSISVNLTTQESQVSICPDKEPKTAELVSRIGDVSVKGVNGSEQQVVQKVSRNQAQKTQKNTFDQSTSTYFPTPLSKYINPPKQPSTNRLKKFELDIIRQKGFSFEKKVSTSDLKQVVQLNQQRQKQQRPVMHLNNQLYQLKASN